MAKALTVQSKEWVGARHQTMDFVTALCMHIALFYCYIQIHKEEIRLPQCKEKHPLSNLGQNKWTRNQIILWKEEISSAFSVVVDSWNQLKASPFKQFWVVYLLKKISFLFWEKYAWFLFKNILFFYVDFSYFWSKELLCPYKIIWNFVKKHQEQ